MNVCVTTERRRYLQTLRALKQQRDAAVVRMFPAAQLALLGVLTVDWRVVQTAQRCAVLISCGRHGSVNTSLVQQA